MRKPSLQDEFREPEGRHFVRPVAELAVAPNTARTEPRAAALSTPRGALGRDPGDRVQRPTENFPVLHLETEMPAAPWDVVVDGLVTSPTKWALNSVASMASERRIWDLNYVWG